MEILPKQIAYNNSDVLTMERQAIDAIKVKTPFYCYSAGCIAENFLRYKQHFPQALICYAVKANSNLSILRLLSSMGAGMDVVSGGEIRLARMSGASPIVFSGIGKSEEELLLALSSGGVYQINLESLSELLLLQRIAKKLQSIVSAAIRINPVIDSGTQSDGITTGRRGDKFGLLEEDLDALIANIDPKYVDLVGLSVHIGSNIINIDPVRALSRYLKGLVPRLRAKGLNIRRLDLGGGLGIRYAADDGKIDIENYAQILNDLASDLDCELIIEPGRSLVGNAGLLITRVEHIKFSGGDRFIIVDAGMSDFMRKAIYSDAKHEIIPVTCPEGPTGSCSVFGPVCESSDIFARDIKLPLRLERGDLLAICSVGAYGFAMANGYNSRPLPAEILVSGGQYSLIRNRQSYEQLLGEY